MGISYSSSGSDGPSKVDDIELATDASNPPPLPDIGMNEEQRQKLRRLEVALIEYRESLEERGIKNPEEIESKVAIHRKWLESDFGLSESSYDVSCNRKTSLERRDGRDDTLDSSRKRHRSMGRSESPPRKPLNRNDSERERERHRDRDRDLREKSGSRDKDELDRDRSRDRDRDWRRQMK